MGLWDDLRKLVGGKPVLGPSGTAAVARPTSHPPKEALATESGMAGGEAGSHTASHHAATSPGATAPHAPGAAPHAPGELPAVQVLLQGPLTDLKRTTRFLASVGIESQIIMPPGGCGT